MLNLSRIIQRQSAAAVVATRSLTAQALREKSGIKEQYNNWINGQSVPSSTGKYFDNVTPVNGQVLNQIARSNADDINAALDAAHAAFPAWSRTSVTQRSNMLLEIANVLEKNLDRLALMETIDNGKPIRETTLADLPLVVDHFRYFAGCIRADEGGFSEIDHNTVSIHCHEPIGVVGQIIPWNFPLLMAAWKLAPALAAGNTVVMKPAEQTPVVITEAMELIKDILPPGVVNIVHGFGPEAGAALATSNRINKLAFTGETSTGQLILTSAAANIIPVTMELGGKSPNLFFESVMDADDSFFDKCLEGAALFALNQGEVCTCPSRILVQESIADAFVDRLRDRVKKIKVGNPLDMETQVGAQASQEQFEKIQKYLAIGKEEGAEVIAGGNVAQGVEGGYYIEPTVFRGHNKMRVFQEEIFGPVASLCTFKTPEEAVQIANDTAYGLGAGVFTRNAFEAYQVPRAIQAGRVWVNNYHNYPAHAAFGGYKKSGFGRETHKMMLNHYRQTKNLLISYSDSALGFF